MKVPFPALLCVCVLLSPCDSLEGPLNSVFYPHEFSSLSLSRLGPRLSLSGWTCSYAGMRGVPNIPGAPFLVARAQGGCRYIGPYFIPP